MEQEPRSAVEGLDPNEVDQVAEHIDDPVPDSAGAATPPGGPLQFARMTGSSIAGRDAAGWVTDFLSAAYYRRPAGEREVDDLRLAFATLTTYWYRKERPRRLRVTDLGDFHRAYGRRRFDTRDSGRGQLSRAQLLQGAAQLLGRWFPDAYADDARRAWGIAFPSVQERDAYDPASRLALAKLGKLTPESAAPESQTWHTYPPVEMPSVEGVVAALTRPETWPDYASELGRFTPLRAGGLDGQTFEVEVAAGTESGLPIFTRGYVTITRLVTPDDPEALRKYFEELESGLARYGKDEPRAVPEGGEPVVGFDLTTHEGHFMGAGHNRLILYTHDGRAWVRAAGTWDPMPWHVEQSYRLAGQSAQHAFWGQGEIERLSLLHQLALSVG
jgi:hypothetical protein